MLRKDKRPQNNQVKMRAMLPMTICCTKCGEFIGKGTKYNCRLEVANNKSYLGIKVWRLYMKCTSCSIELTILTDPKNDDYQCESNCRSTFDSLKIEQDAETVEQLIKKSEKHDHDQIKHLQRKMQQEKYQMNLMDTIGQLQNINKNHAFIDHDKVLDIIYQNNSNLCINTKSNNNSGKKRGFSKDNDVDELLAFRAKKRLKLNPQIVNINLNKIHAIKDLNEDSCNKNSGGTSEEQDIDVAIDRFENEDVDNILAKKYGKYKTEQEQKKHDKEKTKEKEKEKDKESQIDETQFAGLSNDLFNCYSRDSLGSKRYSVGLKSTNDATKVVDDSSDIVLVKKLSKKKKKKKKKKHMKRKDKAK